MKSSMIEYIRYHYLYGVCVVINIYGNESYKPLFTLEEWSNQGGE